MKKLLAIVALFVSVSFAQTDSLKLSPFDHLGHNMLLSAFGWPLGIHMLGGALTYKFSMENNEIQGLVGVKNDTIAQAAYLHWACTAPQNNKHLFGKQKFSGVGGHLFAIAADRSMLWGYKGYIYGFALNKELLNHYIEVIGASFLGALHPYHFMLDKGAAQKLLEVYTYEWN